MQKPLYHLRGGIGDLLILFPIVNAYHDLHHTSDNIEEKFNILVTGPLNIDMVYQITLMQRPMAINKIFTLEHRNSANLKETKEVIEKFQKRYGLAIEKSFNHITEDIKKSPGVSKIVIRKADDIERGIKRDYFCFKYKTEDFATFLTKKKFVVINPTGNSNPKWKEAYNLSLFNHIIYNLTKKNVPVVLIGKTTNPTVDQLYNSLTNHIECFGKVVNMFNQTTLEQAVWLLNNSMCNFCFDSGLKNFSFLSGNPTVFVHDKEWENSNPIEAWCPKFFLGNDVLVLESDTVPGKKIEEIQNLIGMVIK